MVTFNIRPGRKYEDMVDQFAELYNQGMKMEDIISKMNITNHRYSMLVKYAAECGLIVKRGRNWREWRKA